MIKILFIALILAFILIAGCNSNCANGEDRNINVTVIENRDIQTNMGLSNNHNVSLDIVNLKANDAKSVRVETYYCNDFTPQFRRCVNNSFNVGDIPPNGHVKKFFEYDRTAIDNPLDGKYQLDYTVTSCLPYTVVENKVIINQR
jgi:hypothetical protein